LYEPPCFLDKALSPIKEREFFFYSISLKLDKPSLKTNVKSRIQWNGFDFIFKTKVFY